MCDPRAGGGGGAGGKRAWEMSLHTLEQRHGLPPPWAPRTKLCECIIHTVCVQSVGGRVK